MISYTLTFISNNVFTMNSNTLLNKFQCLRVHSNTIEYDWLFVISMPDNQCKKSFHIIVMLAVSSSLQWYKKKNSFYIISTVIYIKVLCMMQLHVYLFSLTYSSLVMDIIQFRYICFCFCNKNPLPQTINMAGINAIQQ